MTTTPFSNSTTSPTADAALNKLARLVYGFSGDGIIVRTVGKGSMIYAYGRDGILLDWKENPNAFEIGFRPSDANMP